MDIFEHSHNGIGWKGPAFICVEPTVTEIGQRSFIEIQYLPTRVARMMYRVQIPDCHFGEDHNRLVEVCLAEDWLPFVDLLAGRRRSLTTAQVDAFVYNEPLRADSPDEARISAGRHFSVLLSGDLAGGAYREIDFFAEGLANLHGALDLMSRISFSLGKPFHVKDFTRGRAQLPQNENAHD